MYQEEFNQVLADYLGPLVDWYGKITCYYVGVCPDGDQYVNNYALLYVELGDPGVDQSLAERVMRSNGTPCISNLMKKSISACGPSRLEPSCVADVIYLFWKLSNKLQQEFIWPYKSVTKLPVPCADSVIECGGRDSVTSRIQGSTCHTHPYYVGSCVPSRTDYKTAVQLDYLVTKQAIIAYRAGTSVPPRALHESSTDDVFKNQRLYQSHGLHFDILYVGK